jgi:hypothetical protein
MVTGTIGMMEWHHRRTTKWIKYIVKNVIIMKTTYGNGEKSIVIHPKTLIPIEKKKIDGRKNQKKSIKTTIADGIWGNKCLMEKQSL